MDQLLPVYHAPSVLFTITLEVLPGAPQLCVNTNSALGSPFNNGWSTTV